MTPTRYRKKPVVIEAMQWDGTAAGATPIIDWVLNVSEHCARYVDYDSRGDLTPTTSLHVDNDTYTVQATAGQWVIWDPGLDEFDYCDPDIFAATYEPAEPWEERLDPEWFAREGDVDRTLRTARGVLDRVHHPDTGMYGLLSALVLNLEAMRETAADALQLAARIATDTGTRTPLDEVMSLFGITQADLDALPDDPVPAPDTEGAAQP